MTSAYSDQTVTFSATARDKDGDRLTYQWYWNDSLQQSETESSVSWYWLCSAGFSGTVKVVVSDGIDTAEAYAPISILAGSSLRIDNHDTVSYDKIYITTTADWGNDIYSGVLAPGKRLTVYNLGTAYQYYKATDINNYYYSTTTSTSVSNGYYRIWSLYSTYATLSAQSNVAGNIVRRESDGIASTLGLLKQSSRSSIADNTLVASSAEYYTSQIPKSETFLAEIDGSSLYSIKY